MADNPQSNRRDFLKGKSALRAARSAIDNIQHSAAGSLGDPNDQFASSRDYLIHFEKRAMGCDFQVMLRADQPAHGPKIAMSAFELIEDWEQVLSHYRDDSIISEFNRAATREAVSIPDELAEIYDQSEKLYQETQGAFDISAGPLSRLWGWHSGRPEIPDSALIEEAVQQYVGLNKLNSVKDRNKLYFPDSRMEINVGGIGKGYALDQCAGMFADNAVDDFLFHAGTSSVVTRGVPDQNSDAWKITLRHPIQKETAIADIALRDCALSTSGIQRQGFFSNGKIYGHILDPRTGMPPDNGILSVTVIAPTAAQADALSTAFFVLGPEKAEPICNSLNTSAMFVFQTLENSSIELSVIGANTAQFQLSRERD